MVGWFVGWLLASCVTVGCLVAPGGRWGRWAPSIGAALSAPRSVSVACQLAVGWSVSLFACRLSVVNCQLSCVFTVSHRLARVAPGCHPSGSQTGWMCGGALSVRFFGARRVRPRQGRSPQSVPAGGRAHSVVREPGNASGGQPSRENWPLWFSAGTADPSSSHRSNKACGHAHILSPTTYSTLPVGASCLARCQFVGVAVGSLGRSICG